MIAVLCLLLWSGTFMCIAAPKFALHPDIGTDEIPQHPDYGPFAFAPPQPTKEGALEYSPSFRKAAQSAWTSVDDGRNPFAEAGFSISPSGSIGSLRKDVTFPGKTPQDKITYSPGDLAVFHTHPNVSSSQPSQIDTDAARKIKKVIYVASKDGLWAVGPDGKKIQVFKRDDWATRKKPE